jgi:hypothetical protein
MIGGKGVVVICPMLEVYDMLLQVMISERAKRVSVLMARRFGGVSFYLLFVIFLGKIEL